MQKIYGLLLSLFFTFSANAQVFAPIGAEWYYTNIESFFMPNQGYEKITVVGDTLIQGKSCRILDRVLMTTWNGAYNLPTEYLHISGDTVSNLSDNGQFYVLYNFGAQPGDNWVSRTYNAFHAQYTETAVTVDSINSISINGQMLRQLYVSTDSSMLGYPWPYLLTEKLGAESYIFPQAYGIQDSDLRAGLRCYSDPTFGNYQVNPSISCTQLITGISENNPLFPQKTYPNPSAGLVQVEFPSETAQPKTLRIFDGLGRLVQQRQIAPEQNAFQVNLPTGGLYLFLTEMQGQVVFSQKVIRE